MDQVAWESMSHLPNRSSLNEHLSALTALMSLGLSCEFHHTHTHTMCYSAIIAYARCTRFWQDIVRDLSALKERKACVCCPCCYHFAWLPLCPVFLSSGCFLGYLWLCSLVCPRLLYLQCSQNDVQIEMAKVFTFGFISGRSNAFMIGVLGTF